MRKNSRNIIQWNKNDIKSTRTTNGDYSNRLGTKLFLILFHLLIEIDVSENEMGGTKSRFHYLSDLYFHIIIPIFCDYLKKVTVHLTPGADPIKLFTP